MSKRPLVSIITPVADRWQYIGQCIESVLSQTFSDWEQIIVDDSIGKEVRQVTGKYLGDERVRYFKQEHKGIKGLGATYNKALRLSRGKFIAVLEDDDFWPNDKLEGQLKLFSDEEVVLTWGKVRLVDGDGGIIGDFPPAWKRFSDDVLYNRPVGRILKALLLHIPMGPAVTVMLRREPLEDAGGFWQPEGTYYVDHSTWLKMSLQGAFAYSRKTLGYWRIHKNQVSSTLVQNSCGMAGKVFWDTLTEEEKIKFGIVNLGKSLDTKFWLVQGYRAMAGGETRNARKFFFKAVIKGRGPLRFKAGLVLILSFLTLSLLRKKSQTPLSLFMWLKRIFKR